MASWSLKNSKSFLKLSTFCKLPSSQLPNFAGRTCQHFSAGAEQLLFLQKNFVLTCQKTDGGLWAPCRHALWKTNKGKNYNCKLADNNTDAPQKKIGQQITVLCPSCTQILVQKIHA